ncbi:MAG: hypothetical protein KIS77_21250 [Saprospiraceae bacterium]|nr:hypothetical protein [Saprospiraceae bacterium]
MPRIFSTQSKKFLKQIDKSELELNRFLTDNWSLLFPQYTYISNEFKLEGNVRSKGSSGRIDILAFNPKTKRFVVFELKKDFDRNVNEQASDYRDFIEDNFAEIYLQSAQKYDVSLPKYNEISKDVEVIVLSKYFSQTDIDRAKKRKEIITLIRYFWFENELFLYDYLNNDPDDLIEKENTEKIKKIKSVIEGKPLISETDIFFAKKEESKKLYNLFYDFLASITDVTVTVQDTKIKLETNFGQRFSVIGYSGKTGRKSYLQINTDIDVLGSQKLIFDDRLRPDGTKKGSLGSERYEVFIQNEDQLSELMIFVRNFIQNQN